MGSLFNGVPVGGIYYDSLSSGPDIRFSIVASNLGEELPAERRPTTDDLQLLERLETGPCEDSVRSTRTMVSITVCLAFMITEYTEGS